MENIQFLQKKVELAKNNAEQAKTMLFNKLQELEKAKTTNMIRRFFEGLNKDQIEAEVKAIENRFRISELELQSQQNELDDCIQKKDAVSAGIREFDTRNWT